MKGYKEYMDNTHPSPALKGKIMARIAKEPTYKVNKLFLGIAASIALVLATIWLMPAPPEVVEVPEIPRAPEASINQYVIIPPPLEEATEAAETPEMVVYPLVFTTQLFEEMGSRIMASSFSFPLTPAQHSAIFPNNTVLFEATATYWLERDTVPYWLGTLTEPISLIPPNPQIIEKGVFAIDIENGVHISIGGLVWNNLDVATQYEISHVHGVEVVASQATRYVPIAGETTQVYYLQADFTFGGASYVIVNYNVCNATAKETLTLLVNQIIYAGPPDLTVLENPTIPELRDDRMPFSYAQKDPDLGHLIPQIPQGFVEGGAARRTLDQHDNSLHVFMNQGRGMINWRANLIIAGEFDNIISAHDTYLYDANLYLMPWADSIPEAVWETFQRPIFLAQDITLEVIQARTINEGRRIDEGHMSLQTLSFTVVLDDMAITINAIEIAPEQIWQMLQEVIN